MYRVPADKDQHRWPLGALAIKWFSFLIGRGCLMGLVSGIMIPLIIIF